MSFLKKTAARLQIIGNAMRIGNLAAGRAADEAVNKAQLDAVKPYRSYVAKLTQSGTGAPTVEIFQNNIGNIVWTRGEQGLYHGTLNGTFVEGKTIVFTGTVWLGGNIESNYYSDLNTVYIRTSDQSSGLTSDGVLDETPIEIRVYN